ncbi:MAG TPA: YkgJ family cysteine cluster protein [Terriglobales bacterium]|nr:YkgJ family cysteine cluster protein [Terriglobales bacterium]
MPADSTPKFPSTIFDKTSHWFERAKASLLGQIPCRQGCCRCCIGSFAVTLLDREEILRGLDTLPEQQRRTIQEAAAGQVAIIETRGSRLPTDRFLDQWPEADVDHLVEQCSDLPCPALHVDGSCSLYEFRPLACRSMGIPPEEAGLVQGACEVQASVPLIQLSHSVRRDEDRLALEEAALLDRLRETRQTAGEELLLPYAFLPEDDIARIR